MTTRGKPFKKGHGGRPKGARNKFTTLKDAFVEAFEELDGVQGLVEWAKNEKNRGIFYQMLARMLPKDIGLEIKEERALGVIILPETKNREANE